MWFQFLRFALLLVASWVVMTMTHELGHIVVGYACGGTLQSADLIPWHLPHSLFAPDPFPLATLWGGPLLGVLMPLMIASLARRSWLWFVSHFCTLAGGTYLACAWLTGDRYLDTPRLLEQGAHPVSIVLYCVLTIVFGYVGFRRSCEWALSAPEKRILDSQSTGIEEHK